MLSPDTTAGAFESVLVSVSVVVNICASADCSGAAIGVTAPAVTKKMPV